tara:strand:- start:293 stop:835 length:543 start_codon:yes stop_codon:yes gene_type:complete
MQHLLMILSFVTLSYSATALLDFSDYDDFAKIERSEQTFVGLNPYNPLGVYTRSWNIGNSNSYFKNFETEQRDVNFHWGTTFLIFSGVGFHIKQYWNESKYKPISIFSAYSLSASILFPMMCDDCDPVVMDTQIISSGLDFNILRFNKFDIRFAIGLMGGYSIAQGKGGAAPFIYASLSY